jgi:hypothetical protein
MTLREQILDIARSHANALKAENLAERLRLKEAEVTLLESSLERARKRINELEGKPLEGFDGEKV